MLIHKVVNSDVDGQRIRDLYFADASLKSEYADGCVLRIL